MTAEQVKNNMIQNLAENAYLNMCTAEEMNIVIEALKSQTPKRPDYEGDGYDENGYLIYDTWICPSCEEKYEVDYEKYKYCPNCGQRIDWSGDE